MGLVRQSQGSSARLLGQRPSKQEQPLIWKHHIWLSNLQDPLWQLGQWHHGSFGNVSPHRGQGWEQGN